MSTALRRAVFVDTSGWYAAAVERDENHATARRLFGECATERRPVVVTNYIVAEAYTLFRIRRGAELALRFLREVKASRTIQRFRVDEAWEVAAEELLAKYRDHRLSYVDATSFVAIRQLGVRDVLTFDTDFAVAGFRVLS